MPPEPSAESGYPLRLVSQRNSEGQLKAARDFIEERIPGANETFLVSHLDGYVYYSPLTGTVLLLDCRGAQAVRKHFANDALTLDEADFIDDLSVRGLLETRAAPKGLFDGAGERWAPNSVTFSTTQKCTLRCKYCYAEGGRLDDLDIPWPAAKAAIDVVIANAKAQSVEPALTFLGEGEATAAWMEFTRAIDYFRQQCASHQLTANVALSTNGVFSSSRLDYLAECCTSITFSLDGVREVHDENRILPNGKGSFDLVLANMKGLDAPAKEYDIRSTVTVAGTSKLSDFVRFVHENLSCKRIHFEPVFDVTGVTQRCGAIEQPQGEKFVESFQEARQLAAAFGIELYYSGSDVRTRHTFCGAGGARNFLVTARGLVTSCNEVLQPRDARASTFHYGRWDEASGEFLIDRRVIDRLGHLNVHEMPKCQGCIAKYNCAGDCYAKTAAVHGDPAAAGYTYRCHIARELLKDNLLLEMLGTMVGAKKSAQRGECPA